MSNLIDKLKEIITDEENIETKPNSEYNDRNENRLRVYYGNTNTFLTKSIALVVCGVMIGSSVEKLIEQKQEEKEEAISNSIYDASYLDYELKYPGNLEFICTWMNIDYKDLYKVEEDIFTYDIQELSSNDELILKALHLSVDAGQIKEEDRVNFNKKLNKDLKTLFTFFKVYELHLKNMDLEDLEENVVNKMNPHTLILEDCKNDFSNAFAKDEVIDLSIYNHQTIFDLEPYYEVESLSICASKVDKLIALFDLSDLSIHYCSKYDNNYTTNEVQQLINLYTKRAWFDKIKRISLLDIDVNNITFPNNINVSLDYFEGVDKEQHVKIDSINQLFVLDCSKKGTDLYIDANYIGDFYHEGNSRLYSLNIKNKNANYGFNGGELYMEKAEFEQLNLSRIYSLKLITKEKTYSVECSTLSDYKLEYTEEKEKINVKN